MSAAEPTQTPAAAEATTAGATTAETTTAAPAQDPIIAADDEEPDTDDSFSDRASSLATSSTSLAASILDYRIENGRTYHAYKDGKYKLPNDERENDRLDLQHNLFLLTFNDKLANAPPNDPGSKVGRVLDVGAGTGIWAIDFGDEHPDADVLGVDLSANFPAFTPPNVRFEVDDLEEPWLYSRPFDYIHSRMMNGSVNDWDAYAKKIYDNLNPGGWVEFNECNIAPQSDDGTLKHDSMLLQTVRLVQEASEKFGRPARDTRELKDVLVRAGFVDVRLDMFKWPLNTWPKDPRLKEIGEWSHDNAVAGWEGLCMAMLTRAHDWSPAEVTVAMAQCRREFKDTSIHAYYPVYSIYGRKPDEKETTKAA